VLLLLFIDCFLILISGPSHVGLTGNEQANYLAKKKKMHSYKTKTKTTVESG
jgi:hypothetical protein